MIRSFLTNALVLVLLCGTLSSRVVADQDEGAVPAAMVVRSLDLEMAPEIGFFMFDTGDGGVVRSRATIVPPEEEDGPWLISARVPPRLATEAETRYGIILVGEGNNFAFIPPETWRADGEGNFEGSLDRLRVAVTEKVDLLERLEAQSRTQSETLRRLRADAETIAGIGRIVDLKEDLDRTKREVADTENDIETLKRSVQLAKTRPQPRNMDNMEVDLTTQIGELIAVSRQGKGRAPSRSKTAQELERRAAIVQSTRDVKLEDLKAELKKLQAKRLRMESKVVNPGRSKAVYWDLD